jgi:PilZ domain
LISHPKQSLHDAARTWPRHSNLKDLSVSYEGRNEVFPVHLPDISPTGMFINTGVDFPEGAILKVSFRLAKSNHPIDVRCEVRFCLTGVGVGVEFIGMLPANQVAIAKEIRAPQVTPKRIRPVSVEKRAPVRKNR